MSNHDRGRHLLLETLEPRLLLSGSIGGSVYADLNDNGQLDSGEQGIAAITVYLDADDDGLLDWADANSNSLWDAGEGEQWALTDANGGYAFDNLPSSDFVVRIQEPERFTQVELDPAEQPPPTQEISLAFPNPNDGMGQRVAMDLGLNDIVLISSPGRDVGYLNNGAVFVYKPYNGGLLHTSTLYEQNFGFQDSSNGFGNAIDTDGQRIIVASYTRDLTPYVFGTSTGSEGVVYVYSASGGWTEDAMLVGSDPSYGRRFGFGASIQGSTAVVTSNYQDYYNPDEGYNGDAGAVYFFDLVGGWSEDAKIEWTSEDRPGSYGFVVDQTDFGQALVLMGDQIETFGKVEGAWQSTGFVPGTGYTSFDVDGDRMVATSGRDLNVFEWDGAAWQLSFSQAYAIPYSEYSIVSMDGSTIVAAGPLRDAGMKDSGEVFIYHETPDGDWALEYSIRNPSPTVGGRFGAGVAVSGDYILAGAPANGTSDAGAAYLIDRLGPAGAHRVTVEDANVSGLNFGVHRPLLTISLDSQSDTGTSNSDRLINLNNASPSDTLVFNVGRLLAGDNIELFADNGTDPAFVIGSFAATEDGTAAVTTDGVTTLADDVYAITAVVTNAATDWTVNSPVFVTIDTTAPTATIDPLFTTDTTPGITGTWAGDNLWYVAFILPGTFAHVFESAGGTWYLPDNVLAPLAPGTYDMTVRTADIAGNVLDTPQPGVLTIATTPLFSISDAQVTEGDAGTTQMTFTVTPSRPLYDTSRIDWRAGATVDTATPGVDYTDPGSGSLTWLEGESHAQTITVDVIGDLIEEVDETLRVRLFRNDNLGIGFWDISDNIGIGTIVNDDILPSLSISDTQVTEGDTGVTQMTFTVTPDSAFVDTGRVDWRVGDALDTATLGIDYTDPGSGSLTWLQGESQAQTITIDVIGDLFEEADETLSVTLFRDETLGTGRWNMSDPTGVGTILNDDIVPGLSISDTQVTEGNAGVTQMTFTVKPDAPFFDTSRVDWKIDPGTATPGADYDDSILSGSLVWFAGQSSSLSFSIDVFGDEVYELSETIQASIFRDPALGAGTWELGDGEAVGTIVNDDAQPSPDLRVTLGGSQEVRDFDFGTINDGERKTRRFTIHNDGEAELVVTGARLLNRFENSPFSITPVNNASHNSGLDDWFIAPGESFEFIVFFEPTDPGVFTDQLLLYSNDLQKRFYSINLSGEALFVPGPKIEVAIGTASGVNSHDFGTINEGERLTRRFTVLNTGDSELIIDQAVGLAAGSPFRIDLVNRPNNATDDWAIAVGESLEFIVFYEPIEPGVSTDELMLFSNDPVQGKYVINLTGEALFVPGPKIDVAIGAAGGIESFDFGTINEGERLTRRFTVHNTGDSDLRVDYAVGLGTDSPFSINLVNRPSNSADDWIIAIGETLEFVVFYEPVAPGVSIDELIISSNDPVQGQYVIELTGEALFVPGPKIDVAIGSAGGVESFDFGTVTERVTRRFTVHNNGDSDLVVDSAVGLGTDSPFALNLSNRPNKATDNWTIPVGTTFEFVVGFTPGQNGEYADELFLYSNDPVRTRYTISLTAIAAQAQPQIQSISQASPMAPQSGLDLSGIDLLPTVFDDAPIGAMQAAGWLLLNQERTQPLMPEWFGQEPKSILPALLGQEDDDAETDLVFESFD